MRVFLPVHFPALLPSSSWQRAACPAPCVISFVCSSVREGHRDAGGLTFTLTPSPAPPLCVSPPIHMQVSRHPLFFFHLSTPGRAVVSCLKFKSRVDQQSRGQGGTQPMRGAAVFGCSFFIRGQGRTLGLMFGDGMGSYFRVSTTLRSQSVVKADLICY